MKKLFFVFTLLSLNCALFAAGVTGLWKTVDDETGEAKSIVSVYEEGGKIFGKILFTYTDGKPALLDKGEGALTCDPAKKANEKLGKNVSYCGLVFLKDLKPVKDGKYEDGWITDPKKGKTYRAEMKLEGVNLVVRGKLGPFGRNQTWLPVKAEDLPKGFSY